MALALLGLLSGAMIKITGASGHWVEMAWRQNQAAGLAFALLDYYRSDPGLLDTGTTCGEDARQLFSAEPVEEYIYPWEVEHQSWDSETLLWQVQVRVNWDGGQTDKAVQMCTLLYASP